MNNLFSLFNKSVLVSFATLLFSSLNAQWVGPTGGVLSTNNNVQLSQPGGNAPCVGCPPILPLFETRLTGLPTSGPGAVPGGTLFPFTVAYNGRVGIGTNIPAASLHIANSGNFRMTRVNASSVFAVDAIGRLVLTTDGFSNSARGLFLNNGTQDFYSVTPESLKFMLGAKEVFKVDNNAYLNGDLILTDDANKINFRAYKDGLVWAREVKVNLSTIPPDYVFDKNYNLMPLLEVAAFIEKNKHLPNVPSAAQMQAEGSIELLNMQLLLLEKIEELTLYMIELKTENEALKTRLCSLEKR